MTMRQLAGRVLARTSLPEMLLRYRARSRVAVFGYHRIMPPVGREYPFNNAVISATPDEFARELKYLRDNMDVISISDMLEGLHNPARLPKRAAVITFDDGYFDNHDYALPLLRDAGLPACFFICTGLIGTRRLPWQEEAVYCLKLSRVRRIESPFGGGDEPYELDEPRLPQSIDRCRRRMREESWRRVPMYMRRLAELTGVDPAEYAGRPLFMSWDEVRDLAAAGMEVGGHTRTHPVLSRVDDQSVLDDEIGGCFTDIQRMVGRAPVAFAYPFGAADHMSERADAAIEQAGFQLSFSFIHGFASRSRSRMYRLPRLHATYGDDYTAFRLRTAMAPALS
jgi:peptidoglycan/xylan/chitin deacetylase (PgdA/CDA1 family)